MEITAADFEPVAAWAWEDDNRDYAEEAWQRAEYQRMQEEEAKAADAIYYEDPYGEYWTLDALRDFYVGCFIFHEGTDGSLHIGKTQFTPVFYVGASDTVHGR